MVENFFKGKINQQLCEAINSSVTKKIRLALNESFNSNDYLTVYHRTDKNSAKGIINGGFSKEYTGKNANVAGPGIYFTFSPEDSTNLTRYYGPVMLKCRLDKGIKGFLVPQGLTVNGNKYVKPLIEQLLDLTYPKYRSEIREKYYNARSTSQLYISLCSSNDLGKTQVRGILYPFGGGVAGVAADWGSMIVLGYSLDDGKTWERGSSERDIEFIKNHGDAKFALNKFIASGVIKDTFGKSNNSIEANQQYNNGYLRVILSKNNKVTYYDSKTDDLISYEGFDNSISPQVIYENGEKLVVIPVIINGETYQVRNINGENYLYKEVNSYQISRLSDGTPWTTDLYDQVMKSNK